MIQRFIAALAWLGLDGTVATTLFALVLFTTGYFIGRVNEQQHRKRLDKKERDFASLIVIQHSEDARAARLKTFRGGKEN